MKAVYSVKRGLAISFTLLLMLTAMSAFSAAHLEVSNGLELKSAVVLANKGKAKTILLNNGTYKIDSRLFLRADDITIKGKSNDVSDVIINGNEMTRAQGIGVIFDISGSNIKIENLTLQNSSNHLIQLRAENDADNFHLSNVRLLNSYEQMIKVSGGPGTDLPTSDNGIIENCAFEYTQGIGPQYYIGGIDAHRAHNWIVRNNTFKNIASPSEHIAEHAIHFWNFSKNNRILGNTIINSDRGIGFGMGDAASQNEGGIIANNTIIHNSPDHPFSDVGIVLESSPGTVVRDNRILLNHGYPNAIEYRFSGTQDVLITNNYTNKRIAARDGASAKLANNEEVSWFKGAWLWLTYMGKSATQ